MTTDLDTFELSNVDPDEISNVLLKVEKSFDFKFGKTELKDVKTFGELCDIIMSKAQGNNSNDCTSQQAFYKIRNAVADTLLLDKSTITLDTDLQKLFPKNIRRQSFRTIDRHLGFKTKVLRPKHSITEILAVTFIASLLGLVAFWQVGLFGLTISIIAMTIANKLGNEFDPLTVRQFSKKISREQYFKSRRDSRTINRNEIEQKVKELFKHDLYVDDTVLTRQATFD